MSLFVKQGRAFALAAMLAIGAAGTAAGQPTIETVFDVNDAKNGVLHGADFGSYTWKNSGKGQLATVSTAPAEGDGFAEAFYNGGGNVKLNVSNVQQSGGADAGAALSLYWLDENENPYNKDISEWNGAFITYSLETTNTIYLKLSTQQIPEGGLVTEGETLTEYNEYKRQLPTSTTVVRRYFPFSVFSQESGWGKTITRAKALQSSHGFNIELGENGMVNLTITKVELSTADKIYNITTSAGSGGTLTASASIPVVGGGVLEGDSVVLTAKPNNGYAVLGWIVGGAAVDNYTDKTYTLRNVSKDSKVEVYFKECKECVSVASTDRIIPTQSPDGAVSVAPVNRITAEFSAGPTPAVRSSGSVSFFRQGGRVSSSTLTVYDASGNAVRKVAVRDDAPAAWKRRIGSWDLKDANGRAVPEGTYLARGVLKTADGKSERVSAVVGVR